MFYTSKPGLRGESAWQLSGAPTYNRRQDATEIIRNMVPVNSYFHMRKNLSENYLRFGHWPSKQIRQSGLTPKKKKKIK